MITCNRKPISQVALLACYLTAMRGRIGGANIDSKAATQIAGQMNVILKSERSKRFVAIEQLPLLKSEGGGRLVNRRSASQ